MLAHIRTAGSAVIDFIYSIQYARYAYVFLLALVVIILAREIRSVLFDRTVYVGNFTYFVDGQSSTDSGKSFPNFVLGQHHLLKAALLSETRARKQEQANARAAGLEFNRLPSAAFPELAKFGTLLADTEIKIQGFDIGKVLTSLRTWITPPLEITGFVEKTGSTSRALVNWPDGLTDGDELLSAPFESELLSSDSATAFSVAAATVWTQTAKNDPRFREIPREVFVAWALAWRDYRTLRSRNALAQDWMPADVTTWKQALALTGKLVPKAGTYPEIWRLRADIIEAAPLSAFDGKDDAQKDAQKAALKIAEDDRKKYANAVGVVSIVTAALDVIQRVPGFDTTKIESFKENITKVAANTTTVRPGQPIWIRNTTSTTKEAGGYVTATAVVDDNGVKKLLLPDYILTNLDAEIELRLAPDGLVIGRARGVDRVSAPSQAGRASGVILAEIDGHSVTNNTVITGETSATLAETAPLPALDAELKLLTSRGSTPAKLAKVEDNFAIVRPRVSASGDGGAPVVDSQGRLVAMAYAGTESESRFLALDWLFTQRQLKLAQ
jgi:hypothetical protein